MALRRRSARKWRRKPLKSHDAGAGPAPPTLQDCHPRECGNPDLPPLSRTFSARRLWMPAFAVITRSERLQSGARPEKVPQAPEIAQNAPGNGRCRTSKRAPRKRRSRVSARTSRSDQRSGLSQDVPCPAASGCPLCAGVTSLEVASGRKWRRKPLKTLETRPEMVRAPDLEVGPYLSPFFAIPSSFSARMVLRLSAASLSPSMPKATAINCE